MIRPPPPGYEVDHRDEDKLNNRRSNLRLATRSQNKMNEGPHRNNRSGARGVSWESQTGKWRATLRIDGRRLSLGRFSDLAEAKRAYERAARKFHGKFYHKGSKDADSSSSME
jgi:hypothetical protein